MPMSRYKIREEYSLADPELYRAADDDDAEALLEGVAMAGLVGILRQLGNLAEFAVEIFHNLHEEVMAIATRGHSLTVKVQQLEAELPSIEKAFLSQTSHPLFFYNTGTNWHPKMRMDQNMVTRCDLPRFVMDSYEKCRGPPHFFLLDKLDIAGVGASLNTDPSVFKVEAPSFEKTNTDVQREKKPRKTKTRDSINCSWVSKLKLDPITLDIVSKMKRRPNGFPFDLNTGKSYMEKLLKISSPQHKVYVDSSPLELPSCSVYETGPDRLEISTVSGNQVVLQRQKRLSPLQSEKNDVTKPFQRTSGDFVTADEALELSNGNHSFATNDILPDSNKVDTEKEILVDGEGKSEDRINGYLSDDIASEIDNYVDAITAMELELDRDSEQQKTFSPQHFLNCKKHLVIKDEHILSQSSDSQLIQNSTVSDGGNSSSKKDMPTLSYSGFPISSSESTPLEDETASKAFPMIETREAGACDSPFDPQSVEEGKPSAQPPDYVVSNVMCAKSTEILKQSSNFGEHLTSLSLLDSAIIKGSIDTGTDVKKYFLMKSMTKEMFSAVDEYKYDSTSVAENEANQNMNPSASIIFDAPEQTDCVFHLECLLKTSYKMNYTLKIQMQVRM